MYRLSRFIPALAMLMLYMLIVMSPLAPLALRSATIAHAVTGECVNDCSICGCSTERSASHTCCCWQKRLHQEQEDEPECCKKKHAAEGKTESISSTPCGSRKSMVLCAAELDDVIPCYFLQSNLVVRESGLIARIPFSPADWPALPPDPPPKLS